MLLHWPRTCMPPLQLRHVHGCFDLRSQCHVKVACYLIVTGHTAVPSLLSS